MEHSSNNITQTVSYIAEELSRHIVFENETHPDAIALWIVGTYLMDDWILYPKLYIHS